MEITADRLRNAHVIRLLGRWDAFSSHEVDAFCENLVAEEGMRFAALDLSGVDYVSSFGLRSLLQLAKRLEPLEGTVHVVGMQPPVRKVFLGSGLASLFPEFPDADSAVSAFADYQP